MSRWEVFKQDAPGKPHQAVGSVHATDARHALITAAHVFVRRPAAVSLWVAHASTIYTRTAQELAITDATASIDPATRPATEPPTAPTAGTDAAGDALEPFEVFCKTSNRRSMTFVEHVGTYLASDAPGALSLAMAEPHLSEGLAWWVVPVAAIASSDPADAGAWFEPAREKLYKQQSQYGTAPTTTARRESR